MLYSNAYYIYALDSPLKFIYLSFEDVNTSHSCITDLDESPWLKSYDVHDQSDEPKEIKVDTITSIPNLISTKTQEIFIPLKLPLVLHDFPPKNYKYPMFDGEIDTLIVEKHVQSFEHFLDLFEVEHVDVCIRYFFQSLQGDAK